MLSELLKKKGKLNHVTPPSSPPSSIKEYEWKESDLKSTRLLPLQFTGSDWKESSKKSEVKILFRPQQ